MSLAISRSLGDDRGITNSSSYLALIEQMLGNYAAAEAHGLQLDYASRFRAAALSTATLQQAFDVLLDARRTSSTTLDRASADVGELRKAIEADIQA
jgi:hypothetical protein